MFGLPHWPVIGSQQKITLGLPRIRALLKVLGDPHLKLPPTIHIAGTNGKGSTIAFMQSIFKATGHRAHRYISPHLLRFNERILLANEEITDEHLFSLLEECRLASEQHGITVSFFEGITAAAFLAFSREKADILLLEVGLGGRLDATNVIEQPLATVITPISFDHEKTLGNTLEQIAYEKTCIIKSKRPCIVSMQTKVVHNVIELQAKKMNAPLIQHECDFGVSISETGKLEYRSDKKNITTPPPSLPGYHQYVNAATPIAAVSNCFSFSNEIFKTGIENATWQGRLTKSKDGKLVRMLPKNFEVWIDSAHNESGAQAIASWLADQPKKDTTLILGMTRNRDVNKFLKHFKGIITKIICVDVHSEPCSYRGEIIPKLIKDSKLKNISTHAEALDEAFKLIDTTMQPGRVLITGSLFLCSDFFHLNK